MSLANFPNFPNLPFLAAPQSESHVPFDAP